MICRQESTRVDYNYKFIEDGIVELTRPDLEYPVLIKYENWCNEYYVIDKWKTL